MRVRGYPLTAFALAACLIFAGMGMAPAHAGVPASDISTTVRMAGGSEHGNFVVHQDKYGSTVSWRPDQKLPMGGARPELYLEGKLLGAPLQKDGTLSIRVPGLQGAKAQELSAVIGGRVLDGAPLGTITKRPAVAETAQARSLVKIDPGTKGKYATESFTYKDKALKVPGYATNVEMQALVVAPKGAKGKRPVVIFLHGRHGTCYVGDETDLAWPCERGSKPIQSYRGYAHQQKLLASQGYITVSISANSINAQDAEVPDAGSGARARLVRAHLRLLAQWNGGAAAGADVKRSLRGRMDLKKVMTVGHSRGGEGVNLAAIQARKGDGFKITGQVLIAPTDFGRQVAVGIPTTVVLPYCDGDVSDLQGQQYVDQGENIAQGDSALRTSVLMMGANHNYFNSEWTPGSTSAPANDDWWDQNDRTCGSASKKRLSAAQQRSAGTTYVAAAARSFLTTDTSAVPLLDGTPATAASAGTAVTLTAAVGGKRRNIIRPSTKTKTTINGKAAAKICDGFTLGEGAKVECSTDGAGASPHWLPSGFGTTEPPSPQALRFSWTKAGGSVTLAAPRDLGTYRNIDLRVITDPGVRGAKFKMVLRDISGRKTVISAQQAVADLPAVAGMTRYWGQGVRFVLPQEPTKIDLRKIASLTLEGTSARGKIYVLDGHVSSAGLRPSTVTSVDLARFDVKDAVVKRDPKKAEQLASVSVPISNSFTQAARVWVEVSDLSSYTGYSGKSYTVKPGQREIKVPVTFAGDDLYVDDDYAEASGYSVTIRALRNAVTDKYTGSLAVRNAKPRPTLTVVQGDVSAQGGGVVRWTMELSAPMGQEYFGQVTAVAPRAAGTELTIAAAAQSWVNNFAPWAGKNQTFSEAGVYLPFTIDAFSTRTTIEIPIRDLAKPGGIRHLEFEVEPDGTFVKKPITLRARIGKFDVARPAG